MNMCILNIFFRSRWVVFKYLCSTIKQIFGPYWFFSFYFNGYLSFLFVVVGRIWIFEYVGLMEKIILRSDIPWKSMRSGVFLNSFCSISISLKKISKSQTIDSTTLNPNHLLIVSYVCDLWEHSYWIFLSS